MDLKADPSLERWRDEFGETRGVARVTATSKVRRRRERLGNKFWAGAVLREVVVVAEFAEPNNNGPAAAGRILLRCRGTCNQGSRGLTRKIRPILWYTWSYCVRHLNRPSLDTVSLIFHDSGGKVGFVTPDDITTVASETDFSGITPSVRPLTTPSWSLLMASTGITSLLPNRFLLIY